MTRSQVRLWLQIIRLAGFVAIYGFIAFRRWRKKQLEKSAQAWPSVDGRLHDGHVESTGNADNCVATFYYDYFVEEYRAGTFTQGFSNDKDAETFVSQISGKRVPIRYNPLNPDESVLEPEDVDQLVLSSPQPV